jgi:hypothetical protein
MLWQNFRFVPAAASNDNEHISGDTTPVKNPALTVIDKLISLSPSPMKPQLISPVKQPVITPVKEAASASVSQVYAYSVNMYIQWTLELRPA